MSARVRQHEIPPTFRNRWIVGGWIDEDPMATRECEVVGWERSAEGRDVVRVRCTERRDLFERETSIYFPHMLFPAHGQA